MKNTRLIKIISSNNSGKNRKQISDFLLENPKSYIENRTFCLMQST